MTVTLSDIRTDVRNRLNETAARFWTDDELDTWINEGARDVARRSETLQTYHTSLIVNSGLGKYPLPTDIIRIHRVEYTPAGDDLIYPVEHSTYQEMDRLWGTNQSNTSQYPFYYVLWGFPPNLTIQLFPVPDSDGNLNIFYYRQPATLTNDTDVVEVPEGWHDLIVLYCEYIAKRKDRDQTWQEAKNLYEDNLQYLLDRTRFWHDQANVISMGRSYLPEWLYGGDEY